jgi:hypothetical protein
VRRSDFRLAEAQMNETSADLGVAVANF